MLKKFQHFLKKIAIFFIECQDEEGDIRLQSLAVSLIHQLFEVWEFLQIMSLCALFTVCSDSDFVGVPDMAPPTGAVNLFSHISHQIV
ncbi:hypothetical protein [Leptospira santarosai]|uniref:hypothetical protein n=1 Tax=Leptospira santarosai TaxID=28183 RepID=UPI0007745F82|nr:hypothetical protein [Leptospira santarosai]